MKTCSKCGAGYTIRQIIDGNKHVLKNRTKCLNCQPFKSSTYRKKTPDEKRSDNAIKARRYYNKSKNENGGIDPIRLRRDTYKKAVLTLVGSQCQFCGYNKCIRNLAFHHLADKSFGLSSRSFQFALKTIIDELSKCVIACHNCHGEIHDNLINYEEIIAKNVFLKTTLTDWHGKEWSDVC